MSTFSPSFISDSGRPIHGHATGVPRQGNLKVNLRPRAVAEPEPTLNAEGRTAATVCECGRPKARGSAEGCDRCRALDMPRARDVGLGVAGAVLQALGRASEPMTMMDVVGLVRPWRTKRTGCTPDSKETQVRKAMSALKVDALVSSGVDPEYSRDGRQLVWSITDAGRTWLALVLEAGI